MAGSRKNIPNHITAGCKQSIMSVYNALGGAEAMLRWAEKNQTDYYRILIAILPKDVDLTVTQTPEARVYPQGAPLDEQSGLSTTSEAVDSVH